MATSNPFITDLLHSIKIVSPSKMGKGQIKIINRDQSIPLTISKELCCTYYGMKYREEAHSVA